MLRFLVPSLKLRTVALAALLGITTFFVSTAPDQVLPVDRPEALAPAPVDAAYCANVAAFEGKLTNSSSSTAMLLESTTGNVYGYISDVTQVWSCTAYYRYDGLAWSRSSTGSTGNFDWGTLIDSVSVSCNWTLHETSYLKSNETNDCPDSDAEYAMPIFLADSSTAGDLLETTFHNDTTPDQLGDFAFIHSDCDTYYGDADGSDDGERVRYGVTFDTDYVHNRPGSNCDPLDMDSTNTNQDLVVDKTAPSVAFDWPATGNTFTVPSAFASIQFDATDAVAGFSGSDDWDLKRRKGTWNGTTCTSLADEATTSGTTNAQNQVVTHSFSSAPDACYQWTLSATDANSNSVSAITSGTVHVEPGATLGHPAWSQPESWDLGAGDSLSVNPGTGNLVVSHPIVSLPIRGSSVDLNVTYNRQDSTNVGMGTGWRLDAFRRLAIAGNGDVTFTDGDGSRHTFTNPQTSGSVTTYTRPSTLYATLVKDTTQTAHEFTLTYRDQSQDKFDISGSVGLLVRVEDRFDNGVDLAYISGNLATITDTVPAPDRVITLTWDTAPTIDKLTSITDWANLDGSGIVQTSGSGNRTHRFFYSGEQLIGWADPLNTSGSCTAGQPSGASHRTCVNYPTNGLEITKTQTVTTLSSGAHSTLDRTNGGDEDALKTTVAFSGDDVTLIKDAQEVADATSGTAFSHPGAWQTRVIRDGEGSVATSLDTTTTYLAVPGSGGGPDGLARTATVRRAYVADPTADWIDTTTTYDSTYPIESATVIEDAGSGRLNRTTAYSYQASSLGLLSRLREPLTATDERWTDYTYNGTNDVISETVSFEGASAIETEYVYAGSSCSPTAVPVLCSMIENVDDGDHAGDLDSHEQDVTTDYTYDAYGQQLSRTRHVYVDGSGSSLDDRVDTWAYDDLGNLTTEIVNYDNGTVAGGTDATPTSGSDWARTDLTTIHTYDTAGFRVSLADPRRAIEGPAGLDDFIARATFDGLGQQITRTVPTTPAPFGTSCSPDPGCRTTTTTYDELGAVRLLTDSDGTEQGTESDRVGRTVATFEDPNGAGDTAARQTSDLDLDAQGRVLASRDDRQLDSSGQTTVAYDELGRSARTVVAQGTVDESTTVTAYDALSRVTSEVAGEESADDRSTITTYDLGGRAIKVDDEFACTTTSYDHRDLATQIIEGRSPGTCAGSGTRTIDQTFDGLGRLLTRKVGSDILEGNVCDSAGRVSKTEATEGGSVRTTETWLNPLDEALEEQRYLNTSGTLTEVTWSRTTRDAAGNETDRCTWAASPNEWCHAASDVTWANPPPVSRSSSLFDGRNQRVRLIVPGVGETTFDPLADYQVDKVYVTTKTDGSGSVTAEHVADYSYDTRDRLTRIEQSGCAVSSGHTCSSSPVVTGDSQYEYDDAGNRTKVIENNGTGSVTRYYCYDGRNQLAKVSSSSATCASGVVEEYAYDEAGNRTSAGAPGSLRSFDYTTTGQLQSCTSADCGTVDFDDDGRLRAIELASGTQAWTYQYDDEGRLATACKASSCSGTPARLDMTYDGEGHRIRLVETAAGATPTVTTTDFTYQGDAVAREVATTVVPGSGTTTVTRAFTVDEAGAIVTMTRTTSGGSAANDGTYLVTWNGHGDASSLSRIKSDGTLERANTWTYETWGKPLPTTSHANSDNGGSAYGDLGFRYLYVGRYDVQWDDFNSAGLLYMHARHYHPEIGRFLQPDPTRQEAMLYEYAANGPVSKLDPNGECPAVAAVIVPVVGLGIAGGSCLVALGMLIAIPVGSFVIALTTGSGTATAKPIATWRASDRADRIKQYRPRKHLVMIGETMKRVRQCATLFGAWTYSPRGTDRSRWMENNRRWIRAKMRERRVILDIGFDPRRSWNDRGRYYLMERNETAFYPLKIRLRNIGWCT